MDKKQVMTMIGFVALASFVNLSVGHTNICEEYANANEVKISYGSNTLYHYSGLVVEEERLKYWCLREE